MTMRYILVIVLLLTFMSTGLHAQTSTKRGVTINRIEIQEGSPYGTDAPSKEIIRKLGLTNRNYRNLYSYWTFPYSSTSSISNLNGSVTGKFTSTPIDLSITNKGQVLSLTITNKSIYWIGVDVSSLNFNISYFSGDNIIPYSGADFSKTLGTLFNFERGEYDYVILPPNAKTEWNLFRIDGSQNGYDIIHSCIKNGSRMDFTIPMYIYDVDPITSELRKMKNKKMYQYSQYTPIQARMNYKGGYYKEDETFHIHNDYIEMLRSSYGYNIKSIKLKFICDVATSAQRVTTVKNKFGLEIYSK